MELWIRSTARTNLLKARFLSIIDGEKFYEPDEWEYKGYTICNCTPNGMYELLGTYETKERALEVLDEIQNILTPKMVYKNITKDVSGIEQINQYFNNNVDFNTSNNADIHFINDTYVYEMPID